MLTASCVYLSMASNQTHTPSSPPRRTATTLIGLTKIARHADIYKQTLTFFNRDFIHSRLFSLNLQIMGNQQSSLSSKISLREPKNYKVVFHNDDFTTMDFVIEILILVFLKSEYDAYNIMLDIHHKGKSTVGTYSFDMARTRTMRATEMARAQGFPLKITIEPE